MIDMEENTFNDASEEAKKDHQEGQENKPKQSGILSELEKDSSPEVQQVALLMQKVKQETAKVLIGQDELMNMLLVAMLSGGNVLLEGVPGIAKTLAARALAKTISTEFSRIQFTPDLMPADILGTTVFNMKTSEFEFRKGPIFSNIILIDEVNRAPAKTQAALIEVMEERQVTTEGTSYEMSYPFFIIATQNPVEQEGTYKLPEAQMDRFLFRLKMDYPDLAVEKGILMRYRDDFGTKQEESLKAVITAEELKNAQRMVEKVHIKDELIDYLARIVLATRNNGDLYLGASPRASLSILKAAKSMALIHGRNYVTPDDIKAVAYHVLNHRIILSHEREMEGMDTRSLIDSLIDEIEVPR
jgi:MoxR-like ATPase